MTRSIVNTAVAAGGIAGLALLLIKGPENPKYTNPRFETAVVTQRAYTPASPSTRAERSFFEFRWPPKTPARYDVTLHTPDCEQKFNNKQIYDRTILNGAIPVTVWDLRELLPGKAFALEFDGGCAITPGEDASATAKR